MARASISPGRLALYAVGLGLFALVSIEAGIRARLYFNDPHSWDKDGLFRYRPRLQVGDSLMLTTNNHGFFGVDLETPKRPRAFRLFLMGSSTLTNPDIPRIVQDTLNAGSSARAFEVNSTGLPRYNSFHNVLLFEHYLQALEPDCLVIYLGLNDNVYNTNPGLDGAPPTGLWNWADSSRSVVLDMLRYHLIHKRANARPDFTEIRSAPIFKEHLRRIIEPAKTRGIAIVLVKEAVGYPTDDPKLLDVIRESGPPMRHFWGNLEPALRGLAAQQAVLDKLAVEYGIPIADPGPVMSRTSAIFRDLCHFTPEGNALFARFVAMKITESIDLSQQPDAHQ